ncbi:DUF2922 domain-containing protein [Serpentinicella sp. ANB-PHB4]|uniref:DUF2922 domain-containing protein n=1 Tax=Serpentinicella sp. ANB-PHB4 TaxID=3074076 RepID=UPI002857B6C2|nr:DUF2922 domain-containing protein [Serpentinicella sp. ANB-PHB4]MDR5659938.1 DUF2922 domain-containing protein [Serpentinicella sp. ANB-PHB4]
MTRTLEMVFKREDGRSSRMTVSNAREDLTGEEVKSAMENIIQDDIFLPQGVALAEVESAAVVTVSTDELTL